ncbi:MAG: hypothetical protein KatS3mg010_1129 [Acidimicrobiia bacterium]|nr:MAG: hypothetical protein KatS3mg010_1129 [Acidimicrobiia bacterium]
MNAFVVAARGKGSRQAIRRARTISSRYGLGPERMQHRIDHVFRIVAGAGCRATLPVTGVVAARHPAVIARYAELGMEFPVHGYLHVDHSARSLTSQLAHLGRARRVLERYGVHTFGFRAPYLRCADRTLLALAANGFVYDASQAVQWSLPEASTSPAYARALDFYGAIDSGECPVVPWIEDGLVRIPYTLPDDEAVIDRFGWDSTDAIAQLWLEILHETHRRGELFTVAVHPERIDLCGPALEAVLDAARSLAPPVWLARHVDIALWWRERARTKVTVEPLPAGRCRLVCTARTVRRCSLGASVPMSRAPARPSGGTRPWPTASSSSRPGTSRSWASRRPRRSRPSNSSGTTGTWSSGRCGRSSTPPTSTARSSHAETGAR